MSEIFGDLDAISWCEKNAADALSDEKVPTPIALMGKKSRIWYEPRDVLLVISPLNYPFFQAIVPIVQALSAGNAVVLKPSEWTPLAGLVESLLESAAIAPNWVQVVYGDAEVGRQVIDQRPDQIMFTGSIRTGRAILTRAAEHLIPVEVIQRANDSVYGLTASVWSADADRAERVARALRVGGVSINNVMATEATQALPFGGVGQSGMGRYKGVHGLRAFSNLKSVIVDKDGDKLEANWYPYTAKKYRMFTAMMRALFTDSPVKLAKFGVLGTRLESYAQKATRRR